MPSYYSNSRRGYGYSPEDRISELMLRRGEIQAEGARRSGDIWGRTVGQLGQIAGEGFGQWHAAKEQSNQEKAWSSFLDSGEWRQDPKLVPIMARKIMGPERG